MRIDAWATCGWLNGTLVVTTDPEPGFHPSRARSVQLRDPGDGSIVRQFALGGQLRAGHGADYYGAPSSLDGALAPDVVTVIEEGDRLHLVSLDLAGGRIGWRGPALPELMENDLWTGRAGEVSLVALPVFQDDGDGSARQQLWLLAFDATGELSGAITYEPTASRSPKLGPSMVHDTVLWLAQPLVWTTRRNVAATPLHYRTLKPPDEESSLTWARRRAQLRFVAER